MKTHTDTGVWMSRCLSSVMWRRVASDSVCVRKFSSVCGNVVWREVSPVRGPMWSRSVLYLVPLRPPRQSTE